MADQVGPLRLRQRINKEGTPCYSTNGTTEQCPYLTTNASRVSNERIDFLLKAGTRFNDTISALTKLQDELWIDEETATIEVDFAIHRPSTGHFHVSTLSVDFPLSGA